MPDDSHPDDPGLQSGREEPGPRGTSEGPGPESGVGGPGGPGATPSDVTGVVSSAGVTGGPSPTDATEAMAAGEATRWTQPPTAVTPASSEPTPPAGTRRAPQARRANGTAERSPNGRARARTNRVLLSSLVAAAVLLVGAGVALAVTHGGSTPAKSSSTGGTNLPASTTPAGPPCPLTGLPSSGPQVPQRPALAVKVDNYPAARPQSGLNQADIVFEEPVEGGITRLVAVFQCQSPSLVGPIRSARAVDVQILDELSDPIFVHAGGIDPVLSLLQAGNLVDKNIFDYGSVVQTVSGRSAPYNTYISASDGWGLDPRDTTPPAAVFSYSTASPSGTPASTLHIPFSGTNDTLWTWNVSSKRWLLSYSGTPATVAGGGQISTTNIVVQTVQVTYGPWLENDVGGYEVQSKMTGSGPLMVLRNGVAISGTWSRPSVSDPTTLTASNGSAITLEPGPTWVEIVPASVKVTTTSPGSSTGGAAQ